MTDPLEDAIRETKKAAKDLALATTKLTRHLLRTAQAAARNPSASAKKAADRAAKELGEAARDVERIIRKL